MSAEFIIAVRGENPDILRRTVEQAAQQAPVHVIYDGAETPEVNGLKADVSIPWGDPRGCGQARHSGIIDSKADVLILTDGHMRIADGIVAEIESHLKNHRKDLLCCQTRAIDAAGQFTGQRTYTGAFLGYKTRCNLMPTIDYHAVAGVWNPIDTKPGVVGCIMGAMYAMRRAWYDQIGRPLHILDEWGGDEEALSLGTHLMGGRVCCLPVICGHLFQAPRTNRTDAQDHVDRRIASRFAVLNAIPMEDREREELATWIKQKKRNYDTIMQHIGPDRLTAILKLRDLWATGKRTWAKLRAGGVVRPLTEAEDKEAMGFRPGTTPGARQYVTLHEPPSPPRPPAYACPRCDRSSFKPTDGWPGHITCLYCGHKQRGPT